MDMEQYDVRSSTRPRSGVAFSAVHWEFDTATESLETRTVVGGEDRHELGGGLAELRDHGGWRTAPCFRKPTTSRTSARSSTGRP